MLSCNKRRAWAEVDLDAILHNYRLLREKIPSSAKLCCVIKANAYSHGAIALGRLYEKAGADFLAVSNLDEALELRLAKISLPILILGYTPPTEAATLARYQISQCVFSPEYAKALCACAARAGVVLAVHIKVDSGMGRIGFSLRSEGELFSCADAIKCCFDERVLKPEGIFTHFASADEGEGGRAFTLAQYSRFLALTEKLKEEGLAFSLRHAANSAATLAYPETSLDMVRAGILLYGISPSRDVDAEGFRPALTLKCALSMVKEIAPGDSVSYGRKFAAKQNMRLATLPIGYGDGVWRACGEKGLSVLVRGQRAPIVGRICMDQCMIDASGVDGLCQGDEVTVYGGGGESVSSLAARLDTIPYEILCALGERIERVYLQEGKVVSVFDRILPQSAFAEGL